jgi:hypothetical protein
MATLQLHLDEETLARARRLASSRQVSVEELLAEALARMETSTEEDDPILGMFADVPELLDEIVEEAMQAREQHPLRAGGDG